MDRHNFSALVVGATLVFGLAPAHAHAPAPAHHAHDAEILVASNHLTTQQVVDRVFSNVERRVLRRYYEERGGSHGERDGASGGKHKGKNKGKNKGKHKGIPPGLAKRGGDLPPGLAKRGGKLPPGLAKRLPSDLERRLPPRRAKYRRVVVDNDIVLIDAATNKVLDVLEGIVFGRR